jgi:hypothetical protein
VLLIWGEWGDIGDMKNTTACGASERDALSALAQAWLNGRAIVRDVLRHQWDKIPFHSQGFKRALIGA